MKTFIHSRRRRGHETGKKIRNEKIAGESWHEIWSPSRQIDPFFRLDKKSWNYEALERLGYIITESRICDVLRN